MKRGQRTERQSSLVALRRQQCCAYREQSEGECEVSRLLEKSPEYRKFAENHCLPWLEVHHVYGRGNEASECFENYLLVEKSCHDFGHDLSPRGFELVCLYVKLVEQRADRNVLEKLCGMASLEGRIAYLANDQTEFFTGLAKDLMWFLEQRDATGDWLRVVHSCECDEEGNCPVCGIDFGDCGCPGPTQDGYEYRDGPDCLLARWVGDAQGGS